MVDQNVTFSSRLCFLLQCFYRVEQSYVKYCITSERILIISTIFATHIRWRNSLLLTLDLILP